MKITLLFTFSLYSTVAIHALHAQELYKWVDETGVTHYGDALPAEPTQHESFVFSEYQQLDDSKDPADDYYSVQNQLQRLQDRRAEEIKQKQQLAEIEAAKNPQPTPVQEAYRSPQDFDRAYYRPAYLPYGLKRPYKNSFVNHSYKPYKHKSAHANKSAPIDRPRSGIVSTANKVSSKAAFTVSK